MGDISINKQGRSILWNLRYGCFWKLTRHWRRCGDVLRAAWFLLFFGRREDLRALPVSFVAAGVWVLVLETKKVEWGWRFVVLTLVTALAVSLPEVIHL